jgi:Tol biopolymer transport system component
MKACIRIAGSFLLSGMLGVARGQQAEPVLFAPGVISGPVDDAAPAFSPDGKTVFFHRRGPGFTSAIMMSSATNGEWSRPVVASFSGQWQDIEPAMAPDGSYLIFSSNRPVVSGGQVLSGTWGKQRYPGGGGNLWRVDRKGAGWDEAYRLPEVVNSDSAVFSPAVAGDGSIYFMKPLNGGVFHLYRSQYQHGQYGAPEALSFHSVDTIGDVDPAVAADESYLVFSSKRPPTHQMDLWIVYHRNGQWSEPVSLGATVNRQGRDIEARLSPDGRTLYFACPFVSSPPVPSTAGGTQSAVDRSGWETGMLNIWSVSLEPWLRVQER